jgi:hypothetical protein
MVCKASNLEKVQAMDLLYKWPSAITCYASCALVAVPCARAHSSKGDNRAHLVQPPQPRRLGIALCATTCPGTCSKELAVSSIVLTAGCNTLKGATSADATYFIGAESTVRPQPYMTATTCLKV